MSEMNDTSWKTPPPPLEKKITCTSSKCEADLHCYRTNMRKKAARLEDKTYRNGSCVNCDKEVVDWNRIDKKDPSDMEYTLTSLKSEYIRYLFWHTRIDVDAKRRAEEKGLTKLREDAEKIIKRTLYLPSNENHWDGRQTPKSGNIIHYAQHAVAACCRKCAEEWHHIPRNCLLTDKDAASLADFVMAYIEDRLPSITAEGKKTLTSKT